MQSTRVGGAAGIPPVKAPQLVSKGKWALQLVLCGGAERSAQISALKVQAKQH